MTPQAIRDGFDALRSDEQMHGLADAARSRSEADWLVGINGTRAMTAFNSRDGGFFLTTVGRVQTPTLAIVVEREEQIRKFVSRAYWEIHADLLADAGEYPGKWFDPKWKRNEDDAELKADRVWSLREAQEIADAVRGKPATVTEEVEADHAGEPAAVRPDLAPARGERPVRLLGQDDALDRPEPVRAPQGADLSAHRFACPAAGLPAGRAADVRDAGQEQHDASAFTRAHGDRAVSTSSRPGACSTTPRSATISRSSRRCEAPHGLSEAEQKLYDLVARRFLAVFFPSAEYLVTTRISVAEDTASRPRARCSSAPAGSPSMARRRRTRARRTRRAWCP